MCDVISQDKLVMRLGAWFLYSLPASAKLSSSMAFTPLSHNHGC